MFVSSPNVSGDPFEVRIQLADLGINLEHVWGEQLIAEAPENWNELFGVPELANVDQSAEEASYGVGIRSAFEPRIENGQLVLSVEQDQIVRLSFAKSEAGFQEISSWHDGEGSIIYDDDLVDPAPAEDDILPIIDMFDDQDVMADDVNDEDEEESNGFDFDFDLGSMLLAAVMAFFGIF